MAGKLFGRFRKKAPEARPAQDGESAAGTLPNGMQAPSFSPQGYPPASRPQAPDEEDARYFSPVIPIRPAQSAPRAFSAPPPPAQVIPPAEGSVPPYPQGAPYPQGNPYPRGMNYPQGTPYQAMGYPQAPGYTSYPAAPGVFPAGMPANQGAPRPQAAPNGSAPHTPPPVRKKSPKSMLLVLYLTLAALVVALGVMGASQMLGSSSGTTAVITLTDRDSVYSGTALIVRNETVYPQQGISSIRYTAKEGEFIQRGKPVCTVYTSGFKAKESEKLSNYRNDLKVHQISLLSSETVPDSELQRLNMDVMRHISETRALIHGADGSLRDQEELLKAAIQARQDYIKQKYPDDTKLSRLYDNEANQLQRIETWAKQFSAADDGYVSFYTDGFENAVNVNNYKTYTPPQVHDIIVGKIPEGYTPEKDTEDVYRLVRRHSWRALMLADNPDWTPVEGDLYQMHLESFEDLHAEATVESTSKIGNKLLVRLSVEGSVLPILYTRSCRLQLSKKSISLSVPDRAIIVQKDANGLDQSGVVAIYTEGEYFIPVEILSREDGAVAISPMMKGVLREGMSVRTFK